MKTIGYLSIPYPDYNIEKDKKDIRHLAKGKSLEDIKWIEEKLFNNVDYEKREIVSAISSLKENDSIIVAELSCLGISLSDCLKILSSALQKKINVYAVKDNLSIDNSIDAKPMLSSFKIALEIDKELQIKRTKKALATSEALGIKLGRPKGPGKSKLDKFKTEIRNLLANGSTQKFIANRYGTTEANLHRWLIKNKLKPGKGKLK